MAALLFVVAWGLIDFNRMREIVRAEPQRSAGARGHVPGDAVVQLEFAILVGVLCSLFVYFNRTTHPRLIHAVAPDPASSRRRFAPVAISGARAA